MDAIGRAFAKEVGALIQFESRVTRIEQDDNGVTVTYQDMKAPANTRVARAAWCVCTIPLSILCQIPISVRRPHKGCDDAVPYAPAVKIGLQFKRRFWEEDEAIYGGISYTDLPIQQIAYPNADLNRNGPGVLLGAYVVGGANSFEFTSLHPAERIARAVELGSIIHPQYPAEFENGISVAWHRVPFAMGCAGYWTDKDKIGALQRSLPDRWPDLAGGGTRVLHSRLARGRNSFRAGRHRTVACPCYKSIEERIVRSGSAKSRLPGDTIRLFVGLTAGALLSLMPQATLAQSAADISPDPTFSTGFKFAEQSGESLFKSVCQACHMPNGEGAMEPGRTLRSPTIRRSATTDIRFTSSFSASVRCLRLAT